MKKSFSQLKRDINNKEVELKMFIRCGAYCIEPEYNVYRKVLKSQSNAFYLVREGAIHGSYISYPEKAELVEYTEDELIFYYIDSEGNKKISLGYKVRRVGEEKEEKNKELIEQIKKVESSAKEIYQAVAKMNIKNIETQPQEIKDLMEKAQQKFDKLNLLREELIKKERGIN